MSEPTISYKRRQQMRLAPPTESSDPAAVIEWCFNEGKNAAHADTLPGKTLTVCPYGGTQALGRTWWMRGYSYSARLFRALKAETELMKLKDVVATLTQEEEQ